MFSVSLVSFDVNMNSTWNIQKFMDNYMGIIC